MKNKKRNFRSVISLMLVFGFIGFSTAGALAGVCDVDNDNDIDRNDISQIFAARGTTATGPDDPRDENGDGLITINDGRACVLQCTLPRCAVPTANNAPVADAGSDQTVLVNETVVLDGSGSSDVDGDPLTFSWSLTVPQGSVATLSDPSLVNPTFDADVTGTYVAQLIVNDGTEDSAPDTVIITTGNSPPVADAGPDQTVLVNETVVLDGSGSSDVDGDPLTFSWSLTVPQGSVATLSDSSLVNPTFDADVAGTYVAQLIVNDGTEDSAPDTVNITTGNSPPVADAGPDQTVLVGDTVVLDGSGSSDVDGDPLTFSWSLTVPQGSVAMLSDPSLVNPAFDADVAGTYVAQLIVNDGTEDSAPDTVSITTGNTPPVADAGPDQTVLVGDTVTLDGTGSSDIDGDFLTFQWDLTSFPAGSSAAISDPNATITIFIVDLPGTYVAQLIVNDGTVDSDPDTAVITTQNSPPVADAGPDQSVLGGDTVTLDGSGSSDADFDPLSFQWAILSAPTGSTAFLSDTTLINPTFLADLAGTYMVQLIVNDGLADSGPDSVIVISASGQADLSITKVDDTDPILTGNTLTYTVTVSNAGPQTAQDVVVTDTLPAGVTFVSTSGCVEDPNGVPTCSLGNIGSGGVAQYTITVTVDTGTSGTITNQATVNSSTADPNTANNTATEDTIVNQPQADLSITKVDDTDPILAGNTLTYTVTVSNAGPQTAQNVVVVDTLPAGVTFVSTSGCAEDPNGVPTCSLGNIGSGGAAQYTITVTVDTGTSGTITNQATVNSSTADRNTANNTATENTVVNPVLPVVTLTATDPNASETGPDTGTFTVTRTGPTTNPLTVLYGISGSASNSTDYQTLSGSVIIPASSATADVIITPIDDPDVEGPEDVVLSLNPDVGYTIGTPGIENLTIADNDVIVTVTATDSNASEAGADSGEFTFTRSAGDISAPLNISVTPSGTATNGTDYASLGGSTFIVTIPATQISTTVTITPLADNLFEVDETVVLTINPTTTYAIGTPGNDTVTITDDTPIVNITATDPAAAEAGSDPGVFTFDRAGGDLTSSLTVSFTPSGAATNNTDYTDTGSSVVISANQTSATVTITPIPDNLVEGDEDATLTINTSGSYSIGSSSSATVTIADDPVVVTVVATDPNASELGLDPGEFTFTRSGGDVSSALNVFVSPSGTATNGTDYASLGGSTFIVIIPANQTSETVTIIPSSDTQVEGDETVILTINPNTAYNIGTPGMDTVTISENAIPFADAGEDETVLVTDTIQLTGNGSSDPEGQPLTYDWSVVSGPSGGVVTFSNPTAQNPTATVNIAGTYVIQLIVNDGTLNSLPDTVEIAAQPVPNLSINNVQVAEGDSGAVNATFTVSLSAPIIRSVTVDFASADGSATVVDNDYVANTGTVTFPANDNTSQTITVIVNGDTTNEPNETFIVNLSNPVNATIVGAQGQGTITNDDVPPPLVVTPPLTTMLTGETATLTVTLPAPASAGGQVVDLASSNTSVATVPMQVTVIEGETSVSFDVTAGFTAGASTITASAVGFTNDTASVTVNNRAMNLGLESPLVGVGRSISGTVTLAQPAAVGGVTVNLSTGNGALATVTPSSVNIAAGQTTAGFTVNGIAGGQTSVIAMATGFDTATIPIGVTSNLISLGSIPAIAPGQIVGLAVSLSSPAMGDVTINFMSSDPTVATVTSSVLVPNGQQVPAANPQVTGVDIGTAEIIATAIGFAPDVRTVTVTISIGFTPTTLNVIEGNTVNITLDLSAPAPAGGFTFDLTSGDTGIATVPLTITLPMGQTSGQVPVTGVTPGSTSLTASAPGIISAVATINVTPAPPINISNFSVGDDLQQVLTGFLGAPAPPVVGVDVTITSADPSRLLLSSDPTSLGSASVSVHVAGNLSSTPQFYLQALDDTGSVQIMATAPGYAADTSTVTLTPSGFISFTTVINTTTFVTNKNLTVFSSRLNPSTLNRSTEQPVRGGLTVNVPVTIADPTVGTITTSPLVFTGGVGSQTTQFDPLNAGATTISIGPATDFETPGNFQQISVNVTAPNINVSDVTVGEDLQQLVSVMLQSAPPSPVNVTVTVADGSIATITTNGAVAGGDSLTFTNVSGTTVGSFFVQGRGVSGQTTTLTATATGYATDTSVVTMAPSGFISFTTAVNTTTFATNTNLTVFSSRLNPSTSNRSTEQPVRGGLTVNVPVTITDPTVGTITTSPLVFTGGVGSQTTQFDPLNAGATTISIGPATDFETPGNFQQISVNVTAPSINITNVTVGEDLQQLVNVTLQSAPPSPVAVTLTVIDPTIALISTNGTVAGTDTIIFNNVSTTSVGAIFVQGVGTSGQTTTITGTATGYATDTSVVTLAPSGFISFTTVINTTTFATNTNLTVFSSRLNPSTLNRSTEQPVRGGLTVNVPVTIADPTVGTITTNPLVFTSGVLSQSTQFDPQAVGSTTISIGPATGFDTPNNFREITVNVTAPDINVSDVTVGEDLQQSVTVTLQSAPPSPVDVTIAIASTAVALVSQNGTVVGTDSVTFSGVTGTTVGTIFVQGVGTSGQSTIMTATAPGYNDDSSSINIVPSGFISFTTILTTTVGATNTNLTVFSSRLNPSTLNRSTEQPVRGGLTVNVPVTIADSTVGTITTSPLVFAGGDGSVSTQFDPQSAGMTTIAIGPGTGFDTPNNFREITATVNP